MAEYQWNASLLRHVFILPEEVADKHLRLAGEIPLKVLLWLSRHGGVYEDEACAQAVGVSIPECRDAVRYWVQEGVLLGDEAAAPTTEAVKSKAEASSTSKRSVTRPQAVKPQLPEVVDLRNNDAEFAYLEDEVGARLGRALAPADRETLMYLYQTAGMPASVILMVIGYAAAVKKLNMRYIEKVALDWADRDVLTIAAAEEHLCRLERSQQALRHVQTVCGLDKPPTGAAAFAAAEKWIYDWNTPDDILRQAYEVCCQKVGKFQAGYMTRVLENWREQGADTVQRIADLSADSKKAGKKAAPDSEYETMVEQYIPIYKKKKKG
ncbi:MAG: DnaD domain protein [Clostridia bacterium]|nr:DnaD domain protein [Clostridia bacterium]